MKRVCVLLIFSFLVSAFAFAEKLQVSYVEGKVSFQSGNEWISVSEGMLLDTADFINVGLNASVAFDNGQSIRPMKKGKIEDLLNKITAKDTMVLGSNLTKDSIMTLAAVYKADSKVGRASEAKEDLDWDE